MSLSITFCPYRKKLSKGIAVCLADKNGRMQDLEPLLTEDALDRLQKRLKASDFFQQSSAPEILYTGDVLSCEWIIIAKEPKTVNWRNLTELGATLHQAVSSLKKKKAQNISVNLHSSASSCFADKENLSLFLLGFALHTYEFTIYKSEKEEPVSLKLDVCTNQHKQAEERWLYYKAIQEGTDFTRDFIHEPPNVLYPATFAERLKSLEEIGISVDIIEHKQLEQQGWGALLGVAQGSEKTARVVVMHWKGGNKDEAPLSFVGKGVTFDTGGISLKPAGGMEEMKFDMGGAGTVAGLMKTLALRKAPINVIGAVGLVENMPSGTAMRPSDVVTSLSRKTIEVLNTDAEGRLVLADVLWHVQDAYQPKIMVNLATLTGAIMVALGTLYAGMFSNNDALAKKIEKAAHTTGERLWRMPLDEDFAKELKSPIADVKNIGKRWGGSITAAQFLEHFVNETPWAHLDIAGVVWNNEGHKVTGKGATGYGVMLLNKLVESYE